MRKKERLCCAVAVMLLYLAACSADEHPLKDGYYGAEAADFDAWGWKEYVTVCVSGGRIIQVEYNAFNASGFIRSWDVTYMRSMDDAKGVYPNAYSRYYGERLILRQGTDDISHLSGATHSYRVFMRLAQTALENARQGNTAISIVTIEYDPAYTH